MVVGITIFHDSFVFSQSCVKISASLTNVGSLAVKAFDFVNCFLSVVRFLPVLMMVSKSCNVVVGLWATQML